MMANKNKQRRENKKPKKERQNKKMTNQADFTKGKQMAFCHKGNSIVYFNDETETALVIGGWKNNAVYDQDTFVIDLTGDEDKYGNTPKAYGDDAEKLMKIVSNSHAGWLSLPFPDYQTPKNMTTTEQWYSMAEGIKEILDSGKNVLVACLGGHGRSGLFCAIVGYILNSGVGWESPVDKIRGIHCSLAIETEQQEQFVYDILGLDLVANSSDYWTAYDNFSYGTSLTSGNSNPCPKCGTESLYIHSNGMCLSCQDKAKKNQAPIMDISTEALMRVKCECGKKNCLGTWVAEKCEHAVHDQLVIDGYCEKCTEANQEAEEKMAEVEKKTKKTKEEAKAPEQKCDICGSLSDHAFWTGLCWGCGDSFSDAPHIHDTLTDNHPMMVHECKSNDCKGIVVPDTCRHAVHDRYVIDGLCPQCHSKREMRKIAKLNGDLQ